MVRGCRPILGSLGHGRDPAAHRVVDQVSEIRWRHRVAAGRRAPSLRTSVRRRTLPVTLPVSRPMRTPALLYTRALPGGGFVVIEATELPGAKPDAGRADSL